MRWLTATAIVCSTLAAACLGGAQGLTWDQQVHAVSARMAFGANGDVFVGSVNHGSNDVLYPLMDHYSAGGVLLHHSVANNAYGAIDISSVVAVVPHGDNVKIFVTFTNSQDVRVSFVVNYEPSTGQISGYDPMLTGGVAMRILSIAAGQDNYAVLATRSADNVPVLQRRKFSDDSIVNETTLTGDVQNVVHLGADEFATSSVIVAGQNSYLRVFRYKDALSTFTLLMGSVSAFNDPISVRSADGSRVWTVLSKIDNGLFNLIACPFITSSNAFGQSFLIDSPNNEYLLDLQSFGTDGMGLLYYTSGTSKPTVATYGPSGLGFTKQVGGVNVGFGGLVKTDSMGNLLTLIPKAQFATSAVTIERFKDNDGTPMNSISSQPDLDPTIVDANVDAAGHVRVLMKQTTYFETIFHVAQINPAAVTVAGTHTVGGDTAIGTVSLPDPAPAGGATFQLFSNSASATVPVNVTIPEGSTSQTFTINTTPVASNVNPTITAKYDGLNVQTIFSISAPLVESIIATPKVVYGGNPITATIGLTGKAPAGGKTVDLISSNPGKIAVQATTTVPAGSMSKDVFLTTYPTLVNSSAIITATTGAISKTVFVIALAPILQSGVLTTNSLKGGQSTTMTLTLGSKAPSQYYVKLLSGAGSIVPLPISALVPANGTSVKVVVPTNPVTSSLDITLVAYHGGDVQVMTLNVHP